MEITWLGHSSVCINSRDVLLITDPYDNSDGEFMPPRTAEIVITSRPDDKHANLAAVTGNPHLVNGPGEYEISHFYISGTGTSAHDEDQPGRRYDVEVVIEARGDEGQPLIFTGNTRTAFPTQFETVSYTRWCRDAPGPVAMSSRCRIVLCHHLSAGPEAPRCDDDGPR